MGKIDYAKAKRNERRHDTRALEHEPYEVTLARKAWARGLKCFVCKRDDRPLAKVTDKWALCQTCARSAPLRINKR